MQPKGKEPGEKDACEGGLEIIKPTGGSRGRESERDRGREREERGETERERDLRFLKNTLFTFF